MGLSIDDTSEVCAWNVGLDGNDAALGGSALAAPGSLASYQHAGTCANGAHACTGEACNRSFRKIETIAAGDAASSVREVSGGAHLRLDGMRIIENATDAIYHASSTIAGVAPTIDMHQALVAHNVGGAILRAYDDGCDFGMRSTTVVDNLLSASVFENATPAFAFADSIVGQPGDALFLEDPAQGTVSNVLYDAIYDGTAPTLWPGGASFMDAPAGDYRLTADSACIDALPAAGGVDLRGRPRDVDIPWRKGMGGIRDLGAFETLA